MEHRQNPLQESMPMSTRSSAPLGMNTVGHSPRRPGFPTSDFVSTENLQVQWGSQDHYEIVRKAGRGKYSEVSTSRSDRRSVPSHRRFWAGRSSRASISSKTRRVSSKSSSPSRKIRSGGKSKFCRIWLGARISWPCWTWFAILLRRSQG